MHSVNKLKRTDSSMLAQVRRWVGPRRTDDMGLFGSGLRLLVLLVFTDIPIKRAEVATAGVVLVLPVVLVFIFSQRFLVSGTLTGVIKE